MQKNNLYAHILLDRSGSMENNRDITIDAFNEYVNGLRLAKDLDVRLSLTLFDSQGIDLIHDAVPVADFPELSRRDYEPRAMTPLLDAIGATMAHIASAPPRAGEKIAFAILTDGLENASREYKLDAIRALIKRRQDEDDWQILFLGAGIDAIKEAANLGLASAQAMAYAPSRSKESFASIAKAQRLHTLRSAAAPKAAFDEEDRRNAKPD
jgi:hypothetical protein